MNEKNLIEDEKFVIEARAAHRTSSDLQIALEEYFFVQYGRKVKDIHIAYDADVQDWIVVTPKGKKRVAYVESIPIAVQELI